MYADERWSAPLKTKVAEPWRKLLLDAADVLETRGHTKGKAHCYETGAVCLVGALNVASHGDPTNLYPHDAAIIDARRRLLVRTGQHPAQWNDAPERTAGEVIALLRETAFD